MPALPRILVLLLAFIYCGCTTTSTANTPEKHTPLKSDLKTRINSSIAYVGQDPKNTSNFTAYYGSSGQQLGILGAIIESMIAGQMENARQERALVRQPIHNAILEYNYGSKFRQELYNQSLNQTWLNINEVRKEPKFLSGEYTNIIQQSDHDVILIFDTYYRMSEQFDLLEVIADVAVYPGQNFLSKNKQFTGEMPILFQNKYSIEARENSNKHTPAFWTTDNKLAQTFDLSIKIIIDLAFKQINGDKLSLPQESTYSQLAEKLVLDEQTSSKVTIFLR